MANSPMKRSGFDQDIYQINASRKEVLGTLRILQDGRKFRYARAGSSALAAGKLGVAAAINADHINEAMATSEPIGTKMLTLTVTAGTAILANELKGGAFQINDETGEGYSYIIESNTAISGSGTSITITLEEGLKVALVAATSEFTLVHNLCNDVVEGTTIGTPVGVALVVVTGAYYYWAQTGGLAIGLLTGTPAAGDGLIQCNAVAGAFETLAGGAIPPIASMMGTAGVDTEYCPIFLMID